MYSKLAFFIVSAFTLGALAAPQDVPAPAPPAPNVSQCDVGKLNCCDSVQDAKSNAVQNLAGLLGLAAGTLTGQVGVNCVPVSVIGASGNNCAAQPTCCTGNNFSGLLTVGCTPVNVNV